MNINENPGKGKFGYWIKTSITARMFMVGFLTLVLLIPLMYVQDLIKERKNRQSEVIHEIGTKWGEEVVLYGPMLKLPYKTYTEKKVKDEKTNKIYTETIEDIAYVYLFPKSLDVKAEIDPEEKYYGIYKTAVYDSKMKVSGSFSRPQLLEEAEIRDEDILWNKAKIIIKTSNLKGVSSTVKLHLGQSDYEFSSKYNGETDYQPEFVSLHTLESKAIREGDLPMKKNVNFSLQMNVKGSKQISFIPIGKETTTEIRSDWKTANFFGEFLPYNDDKITETGFDARWKVLDINRPFSQYHFNAPPNLRQFAYGVNFMIPVDEYQKSERSSKYGFLVIGLTFLIFFLIQSISKIHIHPFQYLMIGLALVMFYTLLISISEHSNFFKAYLIAGASIIVLISVYSKSILKSNKFAGLIAVSLISLYTFIYVIIQLESYALLVGSLGLFLILATVMFVSRKIDWGNQ
ncbi:cell envelope integrity protein CreD [Zhouia spongiae]|uniref:Cell envelope integrity protein CreD n=1 Tax=Zhouia spongiae TaxID=2202721 RepID=A0ABY3YL15_9FLAO|nr:cell envelope integrity protein CreD [Zhouia spongiae]UNY98366.1 cell envelope integrity protein CreD [Zhouia spongiae]